MRYRATVCSIPLRTSMSLALKEYIRLTGSLEAGLQQYAGAANDGEGLYAAKVLAEKQRIESAIRRVSQTGA